MSLSCQTSVSEECTCDLGEEIATQRAGQRAGQKAGHRANQARGQREDARWCKDLRQEECSVLG